MSLFRLEGDGADARLVAAKEKDIELESHLENWLENSPWALTGESLIWIGRQTSAIFEGATVFPDLLGVDIEGHLVIVELKKAKAPREVIAQLLEYAAWAKTLTDEEIHQIGDAYFQTRGNKFQAAFCEEFDTDEVPPLNRSLRLFIVAQRIPDRILKVCQFLRDSHAMDINCIVVSTFETELDDVLVTTEAKVGGEEIASVKVLRRATSQVAPQSNENPLTGVILDYSIPVRWSDDRLARDVVLEAARERTDGNTNVEFAPKELYAHVTKKYPDFKLGTFHGQLTAACPNAPSYIHHSGDYKYYWRVRRGVYRLYDPERDEKPEDEE